MKYLKWAFRIILILLALPVTYTLLAVLIGLIPVSQKDLDCEPRHEVYFSPSSAIHSDFVIPVELISPELGKDLIITPETKFIAFGFGDKNFYEQTPSWDDLKASSVFIAMALPSKPAMHIVRLDQREEYWYPLLLCDKQLKFLNEYILKKFGKDENGQKVHFPEMSYGPNDEFYLAKGSFTGFYTCNTWVNEGLKYIGKPACLWTPFSLGIKWKYPKPE